jgi:hypothetical protein
VIRPIKVANDSIIQKRHGDPYAFRRGEEPSHIALATSLDFTYILLSNIGVKQMLSAKLHLHTDPQQFQAFRTTQLAYKEALNAVSRYAFAQGKTSSNLASHRGMYAQLRAKYHLPLPVSL